MRSRFAFGTIALVLLLGAPFVALAHTDTSWRPYWGPLLSCTGNYGGTVVDSGVAEGGVVEKCTSLCDVLHTFQHFVYFAYTIALFVFAPIAAAVAGMMMLLAHGQPEMISQGKKLLTSTVIGIALMLGAYVIVQTMIYVLDQGRQLGGGENQMIRWGAITCDAPAPGSRTSSSTTPTGFQPGGGGFGGGGATGGWGSGSSTGNP